MKHKFGTFSYEYYLKGNFLFFIYNFYCIIYTKVMIKLIFNILQFILQHYIVKI